MHGQLTRLHAGLIAGLLAALAIAGGLWHAAYRSPQGSAETTAAPTAPAAALPDAAHYWTVTPLRVSDGYAMASPGADQPGFFVANCAVPIEHLYDLPAARDEVQALPRDAVKAVSADRAPSLDDDDLVVGVRLYGHARAYPRNVLARHSIVNDRLGGMPILVYHDPPSGACMTFMRPTGAGEPLSFAASGIGYGGTGLPYDRQTESLWTALGGPTVGMGEPLSGPAREQHLRMRLIAADTMTWAAWRKLWPDTTVMSADTGHDYSFDPYTRVLGPDGRAVDYYRSDLLLAPEWMSDPTGTLPDKTEVLGVLLPDGPLAIPVEPILAAVAEAEQTFTRPSRFGDLQLIAEGPAQRIRLIMPGNVRPPQTRLLWFAWRWCYPETELWQATAQQDDPDADETTD